MGTERKNYDAFFPNARVSIRLVSPASGDHEEKQMEFSEYLVSIRLVSPASGDYRKKRHTVQVRIGFHSISVPSEWGLYKKKIYRKVASCFHSISVPSEWGRQELVDQGCRKLQVSIRLVSPASGDMTHFFLMHVVEEFPFD